MRDAHGHQLLALRSTIANLSETQAVVYVWLRTAKDVGWLAGTHRPLVTDPNASATNREKALQGFLYYWTTFWSDEYIGGKQAVISKSDLEGLEGILETGGASIVYLSPFQGFKYAWSIVGFAGSFAQLANIPATRLPFNPRDWTSADWEALEGLSDLYFFKTPGPAWWWPP